MDAGFLDIFKVGTVQIVSVLINVMEVFPDFKF